MSHFRILTLLSIVFVAAAEVASGDVSAPLSVEERLWQLEQEVARLRENRRQGPSEFRQSDACPTRQSVALTTSDIDPASSQRDPTIHGEELGRLSSNVSQLQLSLQRLETELDQIGDSLSVSLLDKEWSATITGAMIGEMIFAEQRPVIPSAVVLISPDFGTDTPTIDIHGKSTKVGALLRGPDLVGLQTGGAVVAYLFGEDFLADVAGINLIGGYVELKNDRWRFLFGRAGDVVNPRRPGTVDFNSGRNAGNIGFTRGQFRAESYFHPSQDTQVSAQFALCNPIATGYDKGLVSLIEDNGWPLLQGRIVLGAGREVEKYGFVTRRFEIGMSGLLGQLRRADFGDTTLIDVWAYGVDAKADLTECCGLQAEFFSGQGLGNLNGGILQIINPVTLQEVRTIGGWTDFYINWTERLHSSFGFGIDNPLDSTVGPGFPTQNAFVFANLIWDMSRFAEVGFEIAKWDTDYAPAPGLGDNAPGDNEAMIYRTRVVFRF